jgi:hypothetical protein
MKDNLTCCGGVAARGLFSRNGQQKADEKDLSSYSYRGQSGDIVAVSPLS